MPVTASPPTSKLVRRRYRCAEPSSCSPTEPGGATGGTAFTAQPTVAIEDAGGNTVTGDTHAITLARTARLRGRSRAAPRRPPPEWPSSVAAPSTPPGPGTSSPPPTRRATLKVRRSSAVQRHGRDAEPAGIHDGARRCHRRAPPFTAQPTVAIEGQQAATRSPADTHAITLARTHRLGALSRLRLDDHRREWPSSSGCTINTTGSRGHPHRHRRGGHLGGAELRRSTITVGTHEPAEYSRRSPAVPHRGHRLTRAQPTVAIEDAGGNTVTGGHHTPSPWRGPPGSGDALGLRLDDHQPEWPSSVAAPSTPPAPATSGSHATDGGDILECPELPRPNDHGRDQPEKPRVHHGAFARCNGWHRLHDRAHPRWTVEDAGGNTVTTDSSTVTLTANGGTGVITGCSQTETDGVVAYSGCSTSNPMAPIRSPPPTAP